MPAPTNSSASSPTFAAFYPCCLREHSRRRTRVLHFIRTTLFLMLVDVVMF